MASRRTTAAGLCALAFVGVAVADDGVTVGHHSPGPGGATALNAHIDLPQPVALGPSVFPGFPGYATGAFGFSNTQINVPGDDLYMLSPECDISAVMTALGGGLVINNGLHVMTPGGAGAAGTMSFGAPFFDYHPLMQLPVGGNGFARFVIRDASGLYTDSVEIELRFIAVNPACRPDVGAQGGVHGADGSLDNNDFIAFIDLFFAGDAMADLGVQGGGAGADGAFDNNDFIAFIGAFFDGC